MTSCVSLAELAAAGMPLRPAEAVTIAAEMGRQHARGEIPGIPSPGIIRVTRDGQVLAQGPMTREEASVSRAAHLLNVLLAGVDAPADYRAGGGLRLVLARALGTLDLPPYAGLDEFCAALTRFAGPDPVATARGLFRRWEEREPTAGRRAQSGLASSILAFAVTALVALATFAIVMGSNAQSPSPNSEFPKPISQSPSPNFQFPNPTALSSNLTAPMAVPNSRRTVGVREVRPVRSSAAIAARAPNSRPAAGPRARPAPQPRRQAARPRSFFKKLFRIVFK